MSQLTITISDKADALIAQLQKEIFNRRRKKVTAEGVVATLLESGAKSQSDKRFATSWKNLIADIEKAAKVAQAHGSKPSNLTDEEWTLVLSHRTRSPKGPAAASARKARPAVKAKAISPARSRRRPAAAAITASAAEPLDQPVAPARARSTRSAAKAKPATKAAAKAKPATKAKAALSSRSAAVGRSRSAATTAPSKPAAKSSTRKAATTSAKPTRSSVARRMAKAASRLSTTAAPAVAAPVVLAPSTVTVGGNGMEPLLR
ncbi:MAG: hypothetical protein ACH34U_02510 [Cyanobium sp.]|jgi:hypothetical protein